MIRSTVCVLTLLLSTAANAQLVPDTLRAPTGADSVSVFGWSMEIEGEHLLIGARLWPPPASGRSKQVGTVLAYTKENGEWRSSGRLNPDHESFEDCYSWGLDIRGDVAAIGAECEGSVNPDGSSRHGAVYVFRYVDGTWVREAKLYPSDVTSAWSPLSGFGATVALGEGRVVVGCEYADHPTNPDDDRSGAAYVFDYSGDTWDYSATLVNGDTDVQISERFGSAVAVSGDHVLVGASEADMAGIDRAGAAYVFEKDGGQWTQVSAVVPPDPVAFGSFGKHLDADGSGAVLGYVDQLFPFEEGPAGWVLGAPLDAEVNVSGVARASGRLLAVGEAVPEEDGEYAAAIFIRAGETWAERRIELGELGSSVIVERDQSLSERYAAVGAPALAGGIVLVYDLASLVVEEPTPSAVPALSLSIAPSPASSYATVRIRLAEAGRARLTVYDMLGREVAWLADGTMGPGPQSVGFDTTRLATGMYLVVLETGSERLSRSVIVLR